MYLNGYWKTIEREEHRKRKSDRITSGFAKLGGGVTTRTAAGTKTVSDNPNCVRLHPQLRKAAGLLDATEKPILLTIKVVA